MQRTEFDYLHPLDYREEVAMGCRVSRIGRKSFDFAYEVWSESRQTMAARGRTALVAYDYRSNESIVFPEEWKQSILAYEKVAPELEPAK